MAQNLKINILAKDKTKAALNGVRGRLAGLKNAVFSLKGAFVGLGAGLVVKSFVNTGRSIEDLQVRLKALFGSTQEGAKAFDVMSKFAARVPFSLEQIQAASGNLAVVAGDADRLSKILEITGNVAAVTGIDFNVAAEQIQRSFAGGIAAADIFREKGVRDMLGFKAGATVTAAETAAAFERVFGKGGRFGNATDELAKTFEGTLSMIGDKIFNFKKTILESGLFPELKRQFGDLDNFLADNGEQIDKVARSIGEALGKAVAGTANVMKVLARNSDLLLLTLKTLIALKIAQVFYGLTTAINVTSIAMLRLNTITKKNLLIALATGAISFSLVFWDKLKGKIRDLKGEVEELEEILPKADKPLPGLGGDSDDSPIKSIIDETKTLADATEELKKITDGLLTEEEALLQTRDKTLESLKQNAAFLKLTNDEQTKWIGRVTDEYEEATKELEENTEAAKRARDIGKELGMTFSSAFEDAVVEGKKFRDILQGIYKDILRILLRKTITEPAAAFIGDFISGTLSGSLPKAQFGGSVTGGRPHIVGESGPEVFVPSSSGSIVPNHQLGGGTNVVQNINVTTGVQQTVRAEIINMLPMIKQASVDAVLEERNRGGKMAQAMGAITQST